MAPRPSERQRRTASTSTISLFILVICTVFYFAHAWLTWPTRHAARTAAHLQSDSGIEYTTTVSAATLTSPPPPSFPSPPPPSPPPVSREVPQVPTCQPASFKRHVEYDGVVVQAGGDGGVVAQSEVECCERCLDSKACNVWVWNMESGGEGACWLKFSEHPKRPSLRAEGAHVPWASGTLAKGFWDPGAPLPVVNTSLGHVLLRTSEGDIRLRLKEDWHLPSVNTVRRLAAPGLPPGSCRQCEFYRVEYGFLVQGVLRGVLPVNKETGCDPAPQCQPGPRVMQRGDVGWAGGGPGPDFFIYLGKRPADWLKRDHTVWAEVADDDSLALCDRIVSLPSHTPGGPNTMRFLQKRLEIEVVAT
ncbi:hypothetical protein CYMTET_43882 [Cymbomonas tetramitiformis]|uniref:Uncharacterized protein n=1 Tax=Cymbomonas tetramitiformis TaxID=36881 RepID=A0AAE0C385_9CHLO|nr:hypothetical protein CYMTET_43882 [Cymbomonas tetramitiformis]